MESDSNSGGPKTGLIVTIVVVIIGLVGAWYWFMYVPEQEAKEKARQEQIAREAAAEKKKRLQERAAKRKADYERLIQKGDGEFEEESWEAAKSSYTSASSLLPKEQYPKDQLAIVNEKLEDIANKLRGGIVEIISSATGRFYIVVSSSIDGDLAMDYCNELAAEGKNVKMIEPYENNRFYRVTLGDYDTRDQATSSSTSISTADGNDPWILKY
ncbi:MAG: SPOR domain-containing protein [Reichenbachiella sp.]|uniref:SPOR domain-containing protein n=1 Tax=Reichenbachiella sp. TaxID=2184521 RepID=UPI003266D053